MPKINCRRCGKAVDAKRSTRCFCSVDCSWRWRDSMRPKIRTHTCRTCGKEFPITPRQNQKWLCSEECRRARVAKITREWHLRNPEREQIYRARTKAKQLPDSNLIRFRRTNPSAPMKCESCGEHRVLDLAHKPGHERNGAWRSRANCKWPEKVWVLCPTCHALIDRMRYPPEELGLTV